MKKLPVVAGLATALVAVTVPVAFALSDPADALSGRLGDDDLERSARCGQAVVELSVDRERRGFEVDADVDRAVPGSTWKVVVRHDGDKVLTRTLEADAEGDLDVETRRPDTAGDDVFTLRVKNLDTDAKACRLTVSTR
jgi:hypothetical protein